MSPWFYSRKWFQKAFICIRLRSILSSSNLCMTNWTLHVFDRDPCDWGGIEYQLWTSWVLKSGWPWKRQEALDRNLCGACDMDLWDHSLHHRTPRGLWDSGRAKMEMAETGSPSIGEALRRSSETGVSTIGSIDKKEGQRNELWTNNYVYIPRQQHHNTDASTLAPDATRDGQPHKTPRTGGMERPLV